MISKIRQIVKKELLDSTHNLDHVNRVYNLALTLAKDEDVDYEVIQIAALLHDIARIKEDEDDSGNTDHAILGAEMAEKILKQFNYQKTAEVKHCILSHRYRSETKAQTKEAKILFDADKLDVLGSIGVARAFMFGGRYGERIYSETPPEDYIKDNLVDGKRNGRIKIMKKHSPNLEYEIKLKYIPKRLYTKKAKEIAKNRMQYMDNFFERIKREINGEI